MPGSAERRAWTLAAAGVREITLCSTPMQRGAATLAREQLARILRDEFQTTLRTQPVDAVCDRPRIVVGHAPFHDTIKPLLTDLGVELSEDGNIREQGEQPYGDQGFLAHWLQRDGEYALVLLSNTDAGIRNALVTLSDRLYRDANGNTVADPFEGLHAPAFETRHLKTDAMYCGPFRAAFEYWDPTTPAGINAFADWLASFRITDFNLLAFVRGWGATWACGRFPSLTIPGHPNCRLDFYPKLIDRLHQWGIRVWGSDIYMASGYTMETSTCPQMLSPCADVSKRRPFRAGEDSFQDILTDPNAIACLSHPSAAQYYSDVVTDLLEHYPDLDGIDFHVGHTFPYKICRCARCRNFLGNRNAVYRCFARVYDTATAMRPDVQLKVAHKMFADATRTIVDHWEEFPNLQFFSWLRWAYALMDAGDLTDAPVTIGHEDAGGGLEANHDPKKTLRDIRDYYRDFEPWLVINADLTQKAKLASMSWEPALHREMEHMFFLYSQITWEPKLTWEQFALRYVIRSQRRLDAPLVEAYRLALELNNNMTHWGLMPGYFAAQSIIQSEDFLATREAQEKILELEASVSSLGIAEGQWPDPPAVYDLRWSLAKVLARMKAGRSLNLWH